MSYCHSYIHGFADIAKPLNNFTQKWLVYFNWSDQYETAFTTFKEKLVQAPVLAYPQFDKSPPFVLQTDADASYMGIGTMLDQGDMLYKLLNRLSNSTV